MSFNPFTPNTPPTHDDYAAHVAFRMNIDQINRLHHLLVSGQLDCAISTMMHETDIDRFIRFNLREWDEVRIDVWMDSPAKALSLIDEFIDTEIAGTSIRN